MQPRLEALLRAQQQLPAHPPQTPDQVPEGLDGPAARLLADAARLAVARGDRRATSAHVFAQWAAPALPHDPELTARVLDALDRHQSFRSLRELVPEVQALARDLADTSHVTEALLRGVDDVAVALVKSGTTLESVRQGRLGAASGTAAALADLHFLGWALRDEPTPDDPVEALVAVGVSAGDRAFRVMRDATTDPALLCRAMWAGFRSSTLKPTTDDWWRRMAADPGAFDAADVVSLLEWLRIRVASLAQPGPRGQPAGWRDGLDPLLAAVSDLDPVVASQRTLDEPWRSGLAEGLTRAQAARGDVTALIGDGEPDWKSLARLQATGSTRSAEIVERLVAAGWYAEDVPAELYHTRPRWPAARFDTTPQCVPAAPLPDVMLDAAELERLVAALDDTEPGREVAGPPDWVALAALAGAWSARFCGHWFDVSAEDLSPGGVAELSTEDNTLVFEHRGGCTSVWLVGGDGEHGAPPALLARDIVSLLRSRAEVPSEPPAPVPAASVDPRGDPALAAWLSGLPRSFPVIDLRDAATPVFTPVGDRCGEVVAIAPLDAGLVELLLAAEQAPVHEAAAALGLHPLALERRLVRVNQQLGRVAFSAQVD